MRANSNRPKNTMGPAASTETLVRCNWAGKSEVLADILVLLKVLMSTCFDHVGTLEQELFGPYPDVSAQVATTAEGLAWSRVEGSRRRLAELAQSPRPGQARRARRAFDSRHG